MSEKYINIDLNDPRSGKIAEVLNNKTAKKILELVSDKEMSASEISEGLKLPLNTIGYNLDKLVESGLIEKKGGFLWSSKGKKIEKYFVSNKKIVISPKSIMKGIIPSILITGIIGIGIKYLSIENRVVSQESIAMADSSVKMAGPVVESLQTVQNTSIEVWAWFLLGAFTSLALYLLINILNERRTK